jgi:anaerobic selenocysteine-containing dehydrogenase
VREIKTVCARDCPDSCSLTVEVEDSRIVSVRGERGHPVTQGITCPRAASDPERVYSPERILYPHLRAGAGLDDDFKRASWDEALDLASGRLREVIGRDGPSRVLHLDYAGDTGLLSYTFPKRLWNTIGATDHDSAICSGSGHAALALHHGLSYGLQPEELLQMGAIVFWGFNARVSSPHIWATALRARDEAGAIIVAVDPRESETARGSDVWVDPLPGSDVSLAFGLARCLIEEGLIDWEFIEGWTRGFDAFREEALRWTPERVEEVSRVERGRVGALARMISASPPLAMMVGIGLQKSLQGAQAVRAISLLPVLLGQHRGFYYTNSRGRYIDYSYISGEALTDTERDVVSQVALGRHLDKERFKFVYVNGTNPASTLPGQGMVRRGLSRADVFVVVHDTHWTETAMLADVVLPAPTYLEKDDLVISDSHPYVRRSVRAIDPIGESRSEVCVMVDLAGRLGVADEWVYEDPWLAVEKAVGQAFEGGAFGDLMSGAVLKLRSRPSESYQTPSGKIEFYSERARDLEVSPLPVQLPLLRGGDEFILLTSAVPRYLHSQFRDVHGPIPPVAWMNGEDANRLGLTDGERVALSNELGAVEVRAVVTDRIPQGVLWSPRLLTGLNGSPQNLLASAGVQSIGGGPVFNSTRVRARPSMPKG